MPKFRKKPIIVEADQWYPNKRGIGMATAPRKDLAWEGQVYADKQSSTGYSIDTLEGAHEVTPGDWIITGVKGEKYPCKPDIFAMTYESVGEENNRPAIAVDFDGVIHRYSKGYLNGEIYDEPMPGAEEGLKKLMEKYNVFILSTREPRQIKRWMEKHINIPTAVHEGETPFWDRAGVIGITNKKLAAIAYIDDRAVQFDSWKSINKIKK